MADNSQELAFLPAALEIQERPPSPIGRAIVWTIVALFTTAVVWAFFGQLDIVAVAHGKVIPQGRSKVVQPLETSIVRGIYVENGQQVSKGDLLIELDSTDAGANIEQLRYELVSAKDQIVRSRVLLDAIASGTLDPQQLEGQVDQESLYLQQQLLKSSYEKLKAVRAENQYAIERAMSAHTAANEQVVKLEATLPIISERLEALESLESRNLVARSQYLELKQEHIEADQDLKTQRASKASAAAQIAELRERQLALESTQKGEILQALKDLEVRQRFLENDLLKAEQASSSRRLTASVDGVVQQLNVFTVGGVVTPAEQLMVIVPNDQDLMVEAMVLNKDIGFVRENQQATIKLDAFPYTRYGFIDGLIVTLSDDAVPIENLGLAYTASVSLATTVIGVDGRDVKLSPGMAVTVEVKTGKRRVIEYLLSPLLRYKSESARER
jgi:hemolysin D